ncbi:Hint domain-containing protein [Falsirhodobacter sp. alg1]|uniref:Hint domain-containing protein n=1 Tax=Falsirhodobacter sp. alg1 TaxID=1472418 RepID=UPI0005F095CA|nr:Hint domain-containing protein [Falsirhodobacter sp. alg1]
MPTSWNVIYLGSSETALDPVEGNNTSENAALFEGVTFGSADLPLKDRIYFAETVDNGGALSANNTPIMDNDNNLSNDEYNFTLRNGAPLTLVHDAAVYYSATITYTDGTPSSTFDARIVQTTDGNLFLAPSIDGTDIATLEAAPIETITLNSVLNSTEVAFLQDRPNISFIPCLAAGTMVRTARGEVAIEHLTAGDMVETRDNGMQAIRWIGSRKLSAAELAAMPNVQPIRIRAGALGVGLPTADLIVSPQHRMLVRSKIAMNMFSINEVLVAAKQLCSTDGIDIAPDVQSVEYFHMLFENHEVIFANGAETESLFTGPEALKGIGNAALEEILLLFPELRDAAYEPSPARHLVGGRQGRKLAMRHKQNLRSLVS